MKTITPLVLTILLVVVGSEAAINQIWLSPTDSNEMNSGYVTMPDYADAPKGVWTNISTGISGRYNSPLVEIDSKGLIWVISGFSDAYWMNAVWNYDPKTDLYRWVSGSVDNPDADSIVFGDFGIPSADAFPGGQLSFSASTIDRDDNIWFFGSEFGIPYVFWRFNTTSFEFTYFGLNSSSNSPQMVTEKGVPSPLNYPGYIEGANLALDSKNNLWLVGGYNSLDSSTNAVWHFNTTSLEWSWMAGSFNTTESIDFDNIIWNGRWEAGGCIDSDDRIWVFGGWGDEPSSSGGTGEWGDLWSFDTKTLQWRVEWGSNDSYTNINTVVSDDYSPGNIPSARVGAQLVDRLDGTLMIANGVQYNAVNNLNDVWLYNKTLKMWKMVDGNVAGGDYPSNFSNYRNVGGQIGSRRYYGSPSGPNTNGHYIIYGGINSVTPLNDIWVIPQDPCVLCDVNADCNVVDIWSNACTCKQGYIGNGKTCTVAPVAVPNAAPTNNNAPVAQTPQSKSTSGASTLASVGLSTILSVALFLL